MLQEQLIRHGAPTLARLKAASLLRIPGGPGFDGELDCLRALLRPKGLRLCVLRRSGADVLLYLYREKDLTAILSRDDIRCFLSQYGYGDFTVAGALQTLTARISGDSFPHEIGIFLGYPLPDVAAFILNRGRNCVCCGCWKAYTDRCGAMKTFARYAKCKEVYMRLFAAGVPMNRLAVGS